MRFTGRVQGVGFRATARGIARGLPLTGWVRNEPDGSVLLEIQGEWAQIEAYLNQLRDAMASLIAREEVESIDPVEGERAFEVQR